MPTKQDLRISDEQPPSFLYGKPAQRVYRPKPGDAGKSHGYVRNITRLLIPSDGRWLFASVTEEVNSNLQNET